MSGYQQDNYANFYSFCTDVLDVNYARLDDDAQKAAHVLYNDLTYHDERWDERRWLWSCDSDVAQEMIREFRTQRLMPDKKPVAFENEQDFER